MKPRPRFLRARSAAILLVSLVAPVPALSAASLAAAIGPIEGLAANPRYFADGSGKAIYLPESHTWSNLQDFVPVQRLLDCQRYLDFQVIHHFNSMRLFAHAVVGTGQAAVAEGHLFVPSTTAASMLWLRR